MTDFAMFTKLLQQTGDKIDGVRKTLENAEKRTMIIGKKLNKINSISDEKGPDMDQLIGDIGDDEITFKEVDVYEG